MRFVFYTDKLREVPKIVVDGMVPEGIILSHWPGTTTPEDLKRDTSTEIALAFIKDRSKVEGAKGIDIVTNNHFDTDGLLSAWVIMEPHNALKYEKQLVEAATTGDFATFTTPEALKTDLTVMAFADPERSPIAKRLSETKGAARDAAIYEELLGRLPALLEDQEPYRELWEKEFQETMQARQFVRSGGALVREYPDADFSVIESDHHLPQLVRFDAVNSGRVMTIQRSAQGPLVQVEYDYLSWFDIPRKERSVRVSLGRAAADMSALEAEEEGAEWTADDTSSPWCVCAPRDADGKIVASKLNPRKIEIYFHQYFQRYQRTIGGRGFQ